MTCFTKKTNAVNGGGDGDGDSNGGDFPSLGCFWNGVVELYLER